MKLFWRREHTQDDQRDWVCCAQTREQGGRSEFCCDGMKQHYSPRGDDCESGQIAWSGHRKEPILAFFHGEGDEGGAVPIQYCPFCGVAVEFVEEGAVRVVYRKVTREESVREFEPLTATPTEEARA